VSKDGDWRSYCEKSERLHLVPDIERALSLINDPPVILRAALRAWLNDGDGEAEIGGYLSAAVERLEFSVNGNASSGEMQAHAWAGELRETQWPEPDEIDIIDMENLADGTMNVTLSIPLLLTVKVPIELEFSFWDSIDRESVGMGGRTIEMDEELDVRATVNIKVHHLGYEDEHFEVLDCELDASYLEIELGDVDVFEPEDYGQE
jgi:hypothetical protein